MNIVIYSMRFWPAVGGVETTTRLLAKCLTESGHNVTVFTTTEISFENELNEGYDICRSKSLIEFVKTMSKAEIVVMKGGVSAFAALGIILAATPKLVIWHEMWGQIALPGHTVAIRFSNFIRSLAVKRASAQIGVSNACLQSKRLPNAPATAVTRVIYNPVSEELTVAAARTTAHVRDTDVLFVGRVEGSKGVFVLAEALQILTGRSISLSARIVGDGRDRNRLENILKHLPGLSVVFEGNQIGTRLAECYKSTKILIVPSVAPEGMGLVALEGMSFGIPVIASDQEALKEVVGDAGIVVRSGNAHELAAAIEGLLKNDDLLKLLSERGERRSRFFSIETFRREVLNLIREVALQRSLSA